MKSKKIICGVMVALMAFSFASCSLLGNTQTDTQAQLDELNAKIEQQAQEISGLKADKDELTETVEGLQADKDALTETVNALTADKDALLEELNALKAYKDTLEEELNKTEKDNELLLKELNATEEQMEIIFQKLETSYAETYEEVMDWYYETYAPFGVFVDLQTAYDYGVLTMDDLMSISYYQNGTRWNQDIIPEDYTPQPQVIEDLVRNESTQLSEDLQRKMEATRKYEDEVYWPVTYFGCYNGVYVLRINVTYLPIGDYAGGLYFDDGGNTRAYIPQELYPELVEQIIQERLENETPSNIPSVMPSAYEVFTQCNPDYVGTEEEWKEEYYADELMVDESLLEEKDPRYYTIEHVGYDNQIIIHVDTYFMKTEFTVEHFRMVGAIAIEETTAPLTESCKKSGNWPERYCKEYLITLDKHDKQNVADMANLLQGVPYVYAARPHNPTWGI